MSYHARIRKLEKLNAAKNNVVTMLWIDSPSELSMEQLESKTALYLYLEI